MRKIILIFFVITMSLIFSVSYAADNRTIRRNNDATTGSERRIALVIGNADYKNETTLKNPINDANDMEKVLRNLGFDVIARLNAGKKEMVEIIREFGNLLKKNEVGLFYFAGHGIQHNGYNYLIPTDADIKKETDLEFETVNAGRILAEMTDAGNRLNIVILDACRNNPFLRSFRSAARGLAKMDAPTGTLIAYATAPGDVAEDGKFRNSPYTANLLKYMATPGLPVELVFKRVRDGVIKDSGNRQVPWEATSLKGEDFYFAAESGGKASENHKESTLNVSVDVSGANIWLNGTKYGQTPRKIALSQPGTYDVEVTAPGYKKYRVSKSIEIGKEYDVSVHLEKEPEPLPLSAPIAKPSTSQKSEQPVQPVQKPEYNPMLISQEELRLDKDWQPTEYRRNEFKDNGNGTITDHATHLTWQKAESEYELNYDQVQASIQELNRTEFAGYKDWRVPTIEEIMSLITQNKQSNGFYINPIFNIKSKRCWSSSANASNPSTMWVVGFDDGEIHYGNKSSYSCYVRAVRSVAK
jgi:hypothetical protein